MYVRKTVDVWAVEQFLYGEWEAVDHCTTRQDALSSKKTYQKNQGQYPVRVRKFREKL